MGTTSGKTHIQTIFSFWLGTGKHFLGKALCSSENFVMQLSQILHSFAANNVFYELSEEGSGAHPASYPMGTRGSFPGGKAAGA
jgi:hypothetical protein